jgi:hypothetical protein
MSNYLDDYVGVWERFKLFTKENPDYRIKTHVLTECLSKECDVYIVKTEIYRTEVDANPWTTGLSSESKSKQYALELAESGSLSRALNLAGYLAKPNGAKSGQSHFKPIQTTSEKLAEFVKEQRPEDPEPIVHNIQHLVDELGAEIVDEVPICNHGAMVLKQGNKEGKDYRGWVCSSKDRNEQCPAKWMKIDESGKWVFRK